MKSKKKNNTEEEYNIFKVISQPARSSYFLNKNLAPTIYPSQCHFKEHNEDMIKHFKNNSLYEWELHIYKKLKIHELTVDILQYTENTILFNTKGKVLLRFMLKKFEDVKEIARIHIFTNGLLCFLRSLTNFGIVVENISIDNIYVESTTTTFKFYIIDFTQLNVVKHPSKMVHNDDDAAVKSLFNSVIKEKRWSDNPVIQYLNVQLKTVSNFLDYYTTDTTGGVHFLH